MLFFKIAFDIDYYNYFSVILNKNCYLFTYKSTALCKFLL